MAAAMADDNCLQAGRWQMKLENSEGRRVYSGGKHCRIDIVDDPAEDGYGD